jgi:hypothetical protein
VNPESTNAVVWIGVVSVVPRDACELLAAGKGAYVNFLTLARTDAEYRAKVSGALTHYQLELLEFESVMPFEESGSSSDELVTIANELQQGRNFQHVRYGRFHTFPRTM